MFKTIRNQTFIIILLSFSIITISQTTQVGSGSYTNSNCVVGSVTPKNGVCGTGTPKTCTIGNTVNDILDLSTSPFSYTWDCHGIDGGSTASCDNYPAKCGNSKYSCNTGSAKNKKSISGGNTWDCETSFGNSISCNFYYTQCGTSKYKCYHLIYFERFQNIEHAIQQEKRIKGWSRKKKEILITDFNPNWNFLNDEISDL